jgi:hypothetical protein
MFCFINKKIKIKFGNKWDDEFYSYGECEPAKASSNKPPRPKCEPPEEDDRIIALD